MTEDETVGQHHQLNRHELERTLGDSEGQRNLADCSPWGYEQSDATAIEQQQQKNSEIPRKVVYVCVCAC